MIPASGSRWAYRFLMRDGASSVPATTEPLTSVTKALQILLLAYDRGEIGVTETGQELGMSRSSAHRLLVTLVKSGFLRQDQRKKGYSLGPTLVRIGLAAVGDLDIRREGRRPLEELSEKLQETVCLSVLDGATARVIDGVEHRRALRVTVSLGDAQPAHVTAGGKALLAAHRPEDVRAILSDHLPSTAAASITEWPLLERELEDVRLHGWAVDLEESADDLHGVGVAIRSRLGEPLAAVSVTAPASRLRERDMPAIAVALQETAAAIAQTREQR
jgi:DNA-binding IclR family transcriptional regulator